MSTPNRKKRATEYISFVFKLINWTVFSLDTKSAGRQSVASNLTKPDPEEDGDSLAEYGEGDAGMYRSIFGLFYF